LHILAAVDRKGKDHVEEPTGKKSLKDVRNSKRKATAGREFNWSMLYMNVRIIPARVDFSSF
jgi:multiple RNA-binding domain-containing protein 1